MSSNIRPCDVRRWLRRTFGFPAEREISLMVAQITFKILRGVGGRCNSAESAVHVERAGAAGERVAASPALLASEYAWGAPDAVRGAAAALDDFNSDEDRVFVDAIRVSLAR